MVESDERNGQEGGRECRNVGSKHLELVVLGYGITGKRTIRDHRVFWVIW